jgi:arylsulfatase A-like enzyme
MSAPRTVLRTANACALWAFALGTVHAARTIWPRAWVREFQAGAASTAGEKLGAIVQSAAIEGFGFLAAGAALGLAALLVRRTVPRLRADEAGPGYGGALVLCAGAFFGWTALAWIADDALAFLTQPQVLLLDAAGIAALLAGLLFLDALARRCPWTSRASEPNALGSVLAGALATWTAIRIVKSGEEGWREPTLLVLAGLAYLAAVPVAGSFAWLADRPCAWLRERFRAGAPVPLRVTLAAWAALLACGAWTALHLELSPLAGEPSYATLSPRPPGPGPNVVLVTVDTLRADHLGCYGYPRPTSPFVDSLAREGTICADTTAAASWTKPATGTILTGLHPSRHGALYHGSSLHLPEGKETLAEAFRDRGYVTAGFVANPNLKRVFAFDRGFDVYFDAPVEDTVTLACIRGSWAGQLLMKLLRYQFNWNYENDCARMNREVLAWLARNHDQRFFLYVHYIDPHIPYDPPARYREEFARDHGFPLFNRRKELVGIDRYDGEIRYADDGLAELVRALQRHGVWEDTLFVLTSDHGEEFFEHGVLGHGFSLYQEVVHVPLVLRGPGVPAGRVVERPLQVLDLPATVLALAGAGVEEFGDGKSFHAEVLGPGAPEPELHFLESEFGQDDSNPRAFVFTGVRRGPWKLVLTEQNQFFPPADPRHGREALYDLVTDPSERRNLFQEQEHQALIAGLLDRLREHARFLQEQGFRDLPPAALTKEVEAELRALGYIGGQ